MAAAYAGVTMFKFKVHEKPLVKLEPALAQHLRTLRAASPDSANFLARKLFADSMVPGVGNKLAYDDFASRKRGGVHGMVDLNDFGIINKKWGQSTGDEAIKAAFGALSRASRANKGKLFRVGGDEGRFHFDTPEQAYSFARHARQELEALPPVQGQHFHSTSIGFGHNPEHAEQALIQAKNAKKAMNYAPGQAKTHAHSLLTGAVGPVSVQNGSESIPKTIRPPIKPGTSPMAVPSASEPWAVVKSESPTMLVHDNPARPVPVFFLGNDEGLSPDGKAFLNLPSLDGWYGDLAEARKHGFVPRSVLAKSIRLSEEGWCLFEEAK